MDTTQCMGRREADVVMTSLWRRRSGHSFALLIIFASPLGTAEGIDLSQHQWDGRPSLDVLADEAIRKGADLERGRGRVIDDDDAMGLGQREDAEDLPNAMRAVMRVEIGAERADRWSRGGGAARQRQGVGGVRAG
jgi:hypothetical protein